MILGIVVGLALVVAIGAVYLWRKRCIAGRGLAVVAMPAEDWTDEDVDRLLAALENRQIGE